MPPTPTYRPLITDPGESLFALTPVIERWQRSKELGELTGLSIEQRHIPTLSSMPLPHYPDGVSVARDLNIAPEVLWHPMFWLDRTTQGSLDARFVDEAGNEESHDDWALRVCLELVARGLYDEETGLWVDVLADNDIDIDSEAGCQRVEAWQSGQNDPVLDALMLPDATLPPADPSQPGSWAWALARELSGQLRTLQIAADAGDLVDELDSIYSDFNGGENLDEIPNGINTVVALAIGAFASFGEPERHWWSDMQQWVSTNVAPLRPGAYAPDRATLEQALMEGDQLGAIAERLNLIRNKYDTAAAELLADDNTTGS